MCVHTYAYVCIYIQNKNEFRSQVVVAQALNPSCQISEFQVRLTPEQVLEQPGLRKETLPWKT